MTNPKTATEKKLIWCRAHIPGFATMEKQALQAAAHREAVKRALTSQSRPDFPELK